MAKTFSHGLTAFLSPKPPHSWAASAIDSLHGPPLWSAPRAVDRARRHRKYRHEDREFPQVAQEARQELPHRAAEGPRLRDQQDEPPLQGAPGLTRRHPA